MSEYVKSKLYYISNLEIFHLCTCTHIYEYKHKVHVNIKTQVIAWSILYCIWSVYIKQVHKI